MQLIDVDIIASEILEQINTINERRGEKAQETLCVLYRILEVLLNAPVQNHINANDWIDIKDKVPNVECIAYNAATNEMVIGIIKRSLESKTRYCAESDYVWLNNVTHWMHLPASPEESEVASNESR